MNIYLILLCLDAIVALALYLLGAWSRTAGIVIAVIALVLVAMFLLTGAGGFR